MNTKISLNRLSVFFFTLVFVLSGCQPKDTTTTTEPSSNELPVATSSVETSNNGTSQAISRDILLDPAITQDKDSLMISQYLYEGLIVMNQSGEPQPGIAESWVVSDDQLDYVFTLRPGAAFSDGTFITPDTVVDNFNRWFDPKSPLRQGKDYKSWESTFLGFLGEKDATERAKSTVDGVQKVDSNTVLLHLSRPVPETLIYLANPAFSILNTNALASGNYGTKESTIISSGAYVVSSWTDAGLVLSPNPKYSGQIPTADLNFSWR